MAIVGPTAVGKSRLALHLAKTFDGEIVSADSRQVYRCMDVGTGKPSLEELALVPHHLISIADPDEDFTLARYQALAYEAITDIQGRGKLPLLVGGTGLYVRAVLEGWQIPRAAPDPAYRHSLESRAAQGGAEEVYSMLVAIDPEAARKIDRRNVRRVIRALEVYRQTDVLFSRLQRKEAPSFHSFIVGLTAERAELYRRVDERVDQMIRRGLVEEVRGLAKAGYGFNLPSMSSIGYREIGLFLTGDLALAEAIQQIKFETHRFVRHQYAWFHLGDKRIHWFDVQKHTDAEIERAVAGFVGLCGSS